MTSEALWRLTPREYEALSDRYLLHHRHLDEQWATMASMFFNAHKPKEERPRSAQEFMPSARVDLERERKAKQKEIEIAMMLAGPIKLEDVPQWAKHRAN